MSTPINILRPSEPPPETDAELIQRVRRVVWGQKQREWAQIDESFLRLSLAGTLSEAQRTVLRRLAEGKITV